MGRFGWVGGCVGVANCRGFQANNCFNLNPADLSLKRRGGGQSHRPRCPTVTLGSHSQARLKKISLTLAAAALLLHLQFLPEVLKKRKREALNYCQKASFFFFFLSIWKPSRSQSLHFQVFNHLVVPMEQSRKLIQKWPVPTPASTTHTHTHCRDNEQSAESGPFNSGRKVGV